MGQESAAVGKMTPLTLMGTTAHALRFGTCRDRGVGGGQELLLCVMLVFVMSFLLCQFPICQLSIC